MSVLCRSFRQNAWKKDLCSDCFRPENDHQLVDVRVTSNGPSIITTTEWKGGKLKALQSTKVNLTELKKPNETPNGHSYNKMGNNNNNNNKNVNNTYNHLHHSNKKSNPPTPFSLTHTDIHENSVTNGDVNGKVALLNKRNQEKSDELFDHQMSNHQMKTITTNGTHGNLKNGKPLLIKSNSSPETTITQVVGILKMKSDPSDSTRKGSVHFLGEPIVIGYCDNDDSGNEESEEELDYCDYNHHPDEEDDYSEEDSEFSRLTASNTRFNSIGANLRDAKLMQTFGQMNNQSNGIAFCIGDFKSQVAKKDYEETLIGCTKVSELIGEERRSKLNTPNGTNNHSIHSRSSSSSPDETSNNNNNNSSTSSTTTITNPSTTITPGTTVNRNNNYNPNGSNNKDTLSSDELIMTFNGTLAVNGGSNKDKSVPGLVYSKSNGKQEDQVAVKCKRISEEISNKGMIPNHEKSSSPCTVKATSASLINSNEADSSSSSSSSIFISSSSLSSSLTSIKLPSSSNTLTNNSSSTNSGPTAGSITATTITRVSGNALDNHVSDEDDDVNDDDTSSSSTQPHSKPDNETLNINSTATLQAKKGNCISEIIVVSQTPPSALISSIPTIITTNTVSSSSTTVSSSPRATIAPMKSDPLSTNGLERSPLKNDYNPESGDIPRCFKDEPKMRKPMTIKITCNSVRVDESNMITRTHDKLSSGSDETIKTIKSLLTSTEPGNKPATRLQVNTEPQVMDKDLSNSKIVIMDPANESLKPTPTANPGEKVHSEMNMKPTKNQNFETESSSSSAFDEIEKDVKLMDDETESIVDPVNIDDFSSTIDIIDFTTLTTHNLDSTLTSDDDDDNTNDADDTDNKHDDDQPDDGDVGNNEVSEAIKTSSVSLTLTTKTIDNELEASDGDSNLLKTRDNNDQRSPDPGLNDNRTDNLINLAVVEEEKIESIPKKPERSPKSSSKPKIPSKPLSLSQTNKVNEEECFYANDIETHLMLTGEDEVVMVDEEGNVVAGKNMKSLNETDFHSNSQSNHSMVDRFISTKNEFNSTTITSSSWDHVTSNNNSNPNHPQSSRELRLAELAQELESVRHPGKRHAPVPPPTTTITTSSSSSVSSSSTSSSSSASSPSPFSTHETYEKPAKFNTLTRSGLPAPPPRPPPPTSALKNLVNGVTNGYHHGANIFHSHGSNTKETSNGHNSGTKFSLKKLLKLSKDDNDLDHHSGESIGSKIWKHKFDLDRRKSIPTQYHLHESDRSASGSYEINKSTFYGNGRERSYSLSGNPCLPQQLLQQQLQQQQQKSTNNGFRPIVPARRSRSNDINNAQSKTTSSENPALNRYTTSSVPPAAATNGSSNNTKSIINGSSTSSQSTISSAPTNLTYPITVCSSSSHTNSSSASRLPSTSKASSTSKLSSPSDLILTNLNLDSAYSVIAKYNVDTINRILHNYSLAHQAYKSISKKDLFYESFRLIGSETKIYKDAYLKSETISANFIVTPMAYSIRSEASYDLQYGQFIDSEENVKLFALKPEFDLILTLDRLMDEDFSELTGSLNLKSAAFLVLQVIGLFKYYSVHGMNEILEEQLKLTMLCCNRKQATNNVYLISPTVDHVTNVTRDYLNSPESFTLTQCVKILIKNLRRKLGKPEDALSLVEDLLEDDIRSSGLSMVKTLCEIIYFDVPLNFESPGTLELWLDIERTKYINSLNYDPGETDTSSNHRTVHSYYYMLFLTRSNVKSLFQCINQIRN